MSDLPPGEELLALVSAAYDEVPPDSVIEAGRAAFAALTPGLQLTDGGVGTSATYRLDRRLAAAAATGTRVLEGTFRGADPSLTTSVYETADGHLVATVSSTTQQVGLVVLSWSFVDEEGVGETRRLVSPLAPSRDGSWSARYDLGNVLHASAILVTPAEAIAVEHVQPSDLDTVNAVVKHGSARRAWSLALEGTALPQWIHGLLRPPFE